MWIAQTPAAVEPAASTAGGVLARARALLGTLVSVQVWPEEGACPLAQAREWTPVIEQALDGVAHISRVMSAHRVDSDVGRMSRARRGECLRLDAHTVAVLQACQYWWRVSGGAFSPVSAAHALARGGRRPGLQVHAEAAPLNLASLQLHSPTELRMPGPVLLDLGGIAKGYAVDQAVALLARAGVPRAVVNAGGDLRVLGARPQPIAVRHAGLGLRDGCLPGRCWVQNAALATSVAVHPESEFVRTLTTGRRRWRSASVLAADCTSADALTKWALQSTVLCPALRAALRAHRARLWRS